MNKYKFVAELERLLSFMSSWDRQAVIDKYTAMFDEAEDVDILIAKLGSPTKLAISLAREYVPTEPPAVQEPAPDLEPAQPEEAPVPEGPEAPETGAAETAPAPAEEEAVISFEEPEPAPAPVPAEAPAIPEAPVPAVPEEPEEETPAVPGRRARPAALVFYTLGALVIGLPIAVLLIALGVPFLAAGAGVVALAVWGAVTVIGFLTMISDILLVIGAAVIAAAIGLLLAWLGLWISLELGYVWIGKVIFGLGGKLCFKEEVAQS
ncbi:MAG: hypothetical protein ACI4PC_05055 [Oscillospiraceae bacterium]